MRQQLRTVLPPQPAEEQHPQQHDDDGRDDAARLGMVSGNPFGGPRARILERAVIVALVAPITCAIVLQQRAAAGLFDQTFTLVQGIELAAGAINLGLLGLNIRDGFKLTRRFGLAPTGRVRTSA